eukprot:928202-Prymnesium_polylepis.2
MRSVVAKHVRQTMFDVGSFPFEDSLDDLRHWHGMGTCNEENLGHKTSIVEPDSCYDEQEQQHAHRREDKKHVNTWGYRTPGASRKSAAQYCGAGKDALTVEGLSKKAKKVAHVGRGTAREDQEHTE